MIHNSYSANHTITDMILADVQRINGRMIQEAISQWDDVGTGSFKLWVACYLQSAWQHLAELN